MIRNRKQTIWDYAATLKLFDEVNKVGAMDGNLKLQKLSFLAELEGSNQGLACLHFRFFRYTYGPYSIDVAAGVDQLTSLGFCTASRKLTKRGQFFLDYIRPEVEHSDLALQAYEVFKQTARDYGKRGGMRLKEMIYNMVVPVYELGGESMKVVDIPFHADIFVPTCEHNLKEVVPFDEGLIGDLEEELRIPAELLDPEHHSYKKTVKEALSRIRHAVNA